MTIYLGADHGGYELKNKLADWLRDQSYQIEDLGATQFDPEDDYPDFAFLVAEKVSSNSPSKGILICRSGGGMAIAANKVPGIRAVPVNTSAEVEHACDDNQANIITLAADQLSLDQIKPLVSIFLEWQKPAADRFTRRVAKISAYELKS